MIRIPHTFSLEGLIIQVSYHHWTQKHRSLPHRDNEDVLQKIIWVFSLN